MTNPQSPALSLLALCVVPLILLGRGLAARVTADRDLRRMLTPGFALAGWLLAVHLVGRTARSFVMGLLLGTLLASAAGVALWWRRAGEPQGEAHRGPAFSTRGMFAVAVVSTLAVAPAALSWAFHDELFFTGHMSMTAQIQNGIYPPRHLTFPQLELSYHYGFALLCAAVGTVTRLPLDHSLDAVTLACFALTSCLLWTLGHRVGGRVAAPATAVVGLFGAGIPFFAAPAGTPLAERLLGVTSIDSEGLNAPIVSFFFQHPWTVGLPLALTLLLLLTERGLRTPWRYLVFGLVLAALYLGQVVLFLTLGGTLLVAETFLEGRLKRERLVPILLVVVLCALATTALGGFFVGNPDREGGGLVLRRGVSVAWYLQVFGLLLPLGIYGIWRAGLLRIPLAILALGSQLVFNFSYYKHSHDIVKFATVMAVALAIGSGLAIGDLHGRLAEVRASVAVPLAALLTVAVSAAGLTFAYVFAVDMPTIPTQLFPRAAAVVADDDAQAITYLRGRVRAGELVYRDTAHADGYSQWGGLPVPWIDNMVARMGFSAERIQRREQLFQKPPVEAADFLAEGFRWFVLDADDTPWTWLANRWIEQGDAALVAEFGSVQVVELGASPKETDGKAGAGGDK